jgi:serine/threonine protein phosphatase PrpC
MVKLPFITLFSLLSGGLCFVHLLCCMKSWTIFMSFIGNVHAVLVRGNRAYSLTKDHTPNNAKEKNRIIKDGIFVLFLQFLSG